MTRIDWGRVLEAASDVVNSYATSVTLRQLFYRLVSEQLIPNTTGAYKNLSRLSAEARRNGDFPALIDRGRQIHQYDYWDSAEDALDDALHYYRLDRTQGQDVSLYVGVEKAGMVVQLQSWFGHLGIPVLALGGYSSQTYVDDIQAHVRGQQRFRNRLIADIDESDPFASRPAVLLYAGDFDPSGEDIDRDFVVRSGCWKDVTRVALSRQQVIDRGLPINPGKVSDSRAAGFISRHGVLMQVELDALDPDVLRSLFQDAVDGYWDVSAYEQVLERERSDRDRLYAAIARLDDGDDV